MASSPGGGFGASNRYATETTDRKGRRRLDTGRSVVGGTTVGNFSALTTSMGDIMLRLDSVRAPKSVASVLRFARDRHYNGTVFYRVVKGFVIQMGSWDADGKGRSIIPGPVPLEANNGLSNLRGAVAFGRGDARRHLGRG